ncbi:unnamed protein product [Enterobius vermicularis]|uniref:Secreted protein n=1 Tax=Enterobius vermicularis TaxID=51028 RepID=A0A0N4UU86_ENTVE|nr:unnamed protein product [Enterobius vermicularis]
MTLMAPMAAMMFIKMRMLMMMMMMVMVMKDMSNGWEMGKGMEKENGKRKTIGKGEYEICYIMQFAKRRNWLSESVARL